MLKRGYIGTYHHWSVKHLGRYAAEFAGRHNLRPLDTIEQMRRVMQSVVGKRLEYTTLIASRGVGAAMGEQAKPKKRRGRPPLPMPGPIPDTPENVMRALVSTLPLKKGQLVKHQQGNARREHVEASDTDHHPC